MCPEGSLIVGALSAFIAFSASYYTQVSSICQDAIAAWATVYLAWTFYRMAAGQGPDFKEFGDNILAIVICSVLLYAPSLLWEFYKALLSTGVWAAAQAYQGAANAQPATVGELACFAINGIDYALLTNISTALTGLGFFANIPLVLFALLMFFAVALLMLRIIKHVSEPLLDVSILYVLSPFVVVLASIPPLRNAAMQVIKHMVVAIKELIVVSAVVGVMMSLIEATVGGKTPHDPKAGTFQVEGFGDSSWLGSGDYWAVLALVVFFFFAFERAVQMPSRLLNIVGTHSIKFNVPKPL